MTDKPDITPERAAELIAQCELARLMCDEARGHLDQDSHYPTIRQAGANLKGVSEYIRDTIDALLHLQARVAELEGLYSDLLYQVQNMHPNETRHETARRIIHEHETTFSGPHAALAQTTNAGQADSGREGGE